MIKKEPNNCSPFAVSAGHKIATEIATNVLSDGGNAIDAGVAATIALTVLHSEQVQFGGVAPILIHIAANGLTYSIEGAGRWPSATNRALFEKKYRGRIPQGILRTVTPAGPDAWLTALKNYGTMSFEDLATPAWNLARDGFPAHQDLVDCTTQFERYYRRYEENTKIWLPNDQPVQLGQNFIQSNLANTLRAMIDADRSARSKNGRSAGLEAVRDLFYVGEIADKMIEHISHHGGLMTHTDLSSHTTPVVPATSAAIFGGTAYTCGFWSQGPALSQTLQILEQFFLNNPANLATSSHHIILEAAKLAMADRDAYYGDPDFVEAPYDQLLSPKYAEKRAREICANTAFDGLPAAGIFQGFDRSRYSIPQDKADQAVSLDTSIAIVADKHGNLFASTPSDSSFDAPAIPNLGFVMSTRGGQSYVSIDHPACLSPGKRPRVSACPFIFHTREGQFIAGGGPGADLQLQTAVQVMAHHLIFDQPLIDSVSTHRVFTHSAPASTEPHFSFSGKIVVEEDMPEAVTAELKEKGHNVTLETTQGINKPSICIVKSGDCAFEAIGDPRRESGQRLKNLIQNRIDQ